MADKFIFDADNSITGYELWPRWPFTGNGTAMVTLTLADDHADTITDSDFISC